MQIRDKKFFPPIGWLILRRGDRERPLRERLDNYVNFWKTNIIQGEVSEFSNVVAKARLPQGI